MGKLLHSEQQLLGDFAAQAVKLFNGEMVYQVGTSVTGDKPHRDIDLRVMLNPKEFKKLQKIVNIDYLSFVLSLWGQRMTGMPIDFQVQDNEYANENHKGIRSAVGIQGIAKGDGYDHSK